ncbi:uncharacterized protein PV07_10503 [Cladophialophora immunda]|uniref:Uncharacterized protein n=1 Tax=Cladophialophora immunda TaxID=569365 RepID=A0A0D2C0F3_9EURO|nr:uncharacterized protein PV07_10503 [Cladophialophora immunda]KIW24813.1 hypothetical protein PV07_10503 [Cladophialophora immunda]
MARPSKRYSSSKLKTRGKSHSATKDEKKAKAQYEQARRRQWCVVKKVDELHTLCKKKYFPLIVDDHRADYVSSENISEEWPYSMKATTYLEIG